MGARPRTRGGRSWRTASRRRSPPCRPPASWPSSARLSNGDVPTVVDGRSRAPDAAAGQRSVSNRAAHARAGSRRRGCCRPGRRSTCSGGRRRVPATRWSASPRSWTGQSGSARRATPRSAVSRPTARCSSPAAWTASSRCWPVLTTLKPSWCFQAGSSQEACPGQQLKQEMCPCAGVGLHDGAAAERPAVPGRRAIHAA